MKEYNPVDDPAMAHLKLPNRQVLVPISLIEKGELAAREYLDHIARVDESAAKHIVEQVMNIDKRKKLTSNKKDGTMESKKTTVKSNEIKTEALPRETKAAPSSAPITDEELRAKHPEFAAAVDVAEALLGDAHKRKRAAGLENEPQRASSGETNPLVADAERRAEQNNLEKRKEQEKNV